MRNRPAPEMAEVEWDAASIFEHVWRRMKPGVPPPIHAEFRTFAGLHHTIRLRDGRILVRLSDLLGQAPPAVLEAVAVILLSKLYRRSVPQKFRARYRRYVNRPSVRRRIEQIRSVRGRKRTGSAAGDAYDLHELFQRLNRKYFQGLLARPRLGWSAAPARTVLGHFDPAHNAIVISRFLDRPEVPRFLVEFVLYHEMLHLKHPAEPCAVGRRVHSSAFAREEKKFEAYGEARVALKALTCGFERTKNLASSP